MSLLDRLVQIVDSSEDDKAAANTGDIVEGGVSASAGNNTT